MGALAPRWALGLDDAALEKAPGYYPPALTGLRGSHEDKTAHAMRDGAFWKTAGAVQDTGETYDLVVVGGGLSGLAAAYFFREAAGPDARILILDNHDDFGGHAKRNEFQEGGRTILGYGGSFAIDSPAPYSAVAQDLVKRLGVDVASWPRRRRSQALRRRAACGPRSSSTPRPSASIACCRCPSTTARARRETPPKRRRTRGRPSSPERRSPSPRSATCTGSTPSASTTCRA